MAQVSVAFILQALYDCQPIKYILSRRDMGTQTPNEVIQRRSRVLQHLNQTVVAGLGIPSSTTTTVSAEHCCGIDTYYCLWVASLLPSSYEVAEVLYSKDIPDDQRECIQMLRDFFGRLESFKNKFLCEYAIQRHYIKNKTTVLQPVDEYLNNVLTIVSPLFPV